MRHEPRPKYARISELWWATGIIPPHNGTGRAYVPANERPHPTPTPRATPLTQDAIDDWYRTHPRANGHGRPALRTARAKTRAKNAKLAKTGRLPTYGIAPPSATRKYIGGIYDND